MNIVDFSFFNIVPGTYYRYKNNNFQTIVGMYKYKYYKYYIYLVGTYNLTITILVF